MKRKKLLQDELEQIEHKIECEMRWFRQEISLLKNKIKYRSLSFFFNYEHLFS
tara:strand:- start:307 stop:465 length:159 start_codon:yes stop_codon:yes gene_type:complete